MDDVGNLDGTGDSPDSAEAVRTALVPCNLCAGTETEWFCTARDRLHGGKGVFTYVRCRGCGLVYMNPQIIPEDLAKVYPRDYGPHRVAKDKPRTRRSIETELTRVPFIRSLYPTLTAEHRLLDVGCGAGAFLDKIRRATGCAVFGVDNSQAAVDAAKQRHDLDLFHGTLLEAPFAEACFDVVTAWSVLEHLPNPRQVVLRISQLLKDGGHCVIGVPNVASFNARVFRDRWYHLDCPRHLHLFSVETLSRLMGEAGLVIEGVFFDRGARGLLHSLRYQFGDDKVPLSRRRKGPGLSLWKTILRPYAVLLAWCRQSDVIVVHACKGVPLTGNRRFRRSGLEEEVPGL